MLRCRQVHTCGIVCAFLLVLTADLWVAAEHLSLFEKLEWIVAKSIDGKGGYVNEGSRESRHASWRHWQIGQH
jgi:hypothetical protein